MLPRGLEPDHWWVLNGSRKETDNTGVDLGVRVLHIGLRNRPNYTSSTRGLIAYEGPDGNSKGIVK